MVYETSCKELVARVREHVGDKAGEWWTATEVLSRADQQLGHILRRTRAHGRSYDLSYYDVAISSLTLAENQMRVWTPPTFINSISRVEAFSAGQWPLQLEQAELHNKDFGRLIGPPVWHRVGRNIHLIGSFNGIPTLRVWFQLTWAPLHFGKSAGGTTTTIIFDATPNVPTDVDRGGRVLKQTNAYFGHRIRFLSGTNQDLEVEIQSYDRTTNTATFTPAVPLAVAAAAPYSLLVPLPADLCSFLTIDTAMSLVTSAGNDNYVAALSPRYQQALEDFQNNLSEPDSDSPRTLYSTDR